MEFSWWIIIIELEGDHGDFRPLEARWRFCVNLVNSMVFYTIWSWLNHLDMNLTSPNLIRWSWLVKLEFNLCDQVCLDLPSNDEIELKYL